MKLSTRQLTPRSTAEPTAEVRAERPRRTDHFAQERPKRLLGIYLRSLRIRAAEEEVEDIHQLERAGESEWTPWIAITGLILFFAAVVLLMFGAVEAASHLLASASSAD